VSAIHIDKLAWIHLVDGRLLAARSRNKDVYFIPGGKREEGESDVDALSREIREELSVELQPDTIRLLGVFEAQAHGRDEGVMVRMTCYTGEYHGKLQPAAEIEEIAWLSYADRDQLSLVAQIIADSLNEQGLLL
jgi:8-oxo-dGTP diphosphatase